MSRLGVVTLVVAFWRSVPVVHGSYVSSSVLPFNGASVAVRLKAAQTWPEIWDVLATDPRFRDEHWSKAPFLAQVPAVASSFSLAKVRAAAAAGEMLAGQNTFLVKNPESFETAPGVRRGLKITPEVLESGLANGTMVLNDAGSAFLELFEIARIGSRVLRLPVGINVYITHASLERSAPLHTDRQDVFVLQCEGKKHWKVHPPPVVMPAEHQERGKSGNRVEPSVAGQVLLEATLQPGDLLYVPRGFLHTTSRPPCGESGDTCATDLGGEGEFSTSLTIGVQTESMGFTYDKLLMCAMFLHGEGPSLEELRQLQASFEFLRHPLPLPGAAFVAEAPADEPGTAPRPLERAVDRLASEWRAIFPGSTPPTRQRWRKASEIIAAGHERTLAEYTGQMFDAQVPAKLRQEVWKRRYGALLYGTLGRCGFLTRCFPTKFWLPKHTSRQRCWGAEPGSKPRT